MKRYVFIRCFLMILLSVLLVFFLGLGITYFSNKHIVSERLIAETRMASALLGGSEEFDKLRVFYNNDECRVTVISVSGEVLYDSDTHQSLENHLDREEVASALAGEPRPTERYSETFGCMMTYYATKATLTDGSQVIIRLAIKNRQTNEYVLYTLPFLIMILVASFVAALIFSRRLSSSVASKIGNISGSLKSVNEGTYVPLDAEAESDEFRAVYNEINELNERTVSYISSQRELAERKEEFFANASHELKTPLTAMVGLTEIIMNKQTDASTHKQIERIHKESLRMSELISDMLKLSKLESPLTEEVASAVDMRAVADEVLYELSSAASAKNISLSVSGTGTVVGDEKRIYEIFQNLISNGINYNKEGGEVSVMIEENEEGTAVRVRDTGIGIAAEHIPRLCERFYRVDKSRSKKTGGTGLGLAIVKHICAIYGARLEIRSEIDLGTEVTVIFPKNE